MTIPRNNLVKTIVLWFRGGVRDQKGIQIWKTTLMRGVLRQFCCSWLGQYCKAGGKPSTFKMAGLNPAIQVGQWKARLSGSSRTIHPVVPGQVLFTPG